MIIPIALRALRALACDIGLDAGGNLVLFIKPGWLPRDQSIVQ